MSLAETAAIGIASLIAGMIIILGFKFLVGLI